MKQIMFLRLGTKLCVRTLAPKAWSNVQQGPNDSQFKHTLTTVNTAYKWLCSRLTKSHVSCHTTVLLHTPTAHDCVCNASPSVWFVLLSVLFPEGMEPRASHIQKETPLLSCTLLLSLAKLLGLLSCLGFTSTWDDSPLPCLLF